MNGRQRAAQIELRALVRQAKRRKSLGCDIVVCPPALFISALAQVAKASPVQLGAQDCHPGEDGAHTGNLSAAMLADAGAAFAIVGHSERRAGHGESDRLVRAKAEAAHRAGLAAIICVGENKAERRRGKTLEVVGGQLGASMPKAATAANTIVAYEPVWDIGTGLTASNDDVAEVHAMLRARLRRRFRAEGQMMRLLYGGSVTSDMHTLPLRQVEQVSLAGTTSQVGRSHHPAG